MLACCNNSHTVISTYLRNPFTYGEVKFPFCQKKSRLRVTSKFYVTFQLTWELNQLFTDYTTFHMKAAQVCITEKFLCETWHDSSLLKVCSLCLSLKSDCFHKLFNKFVQVTDHFSSLFEVGWLIDRRKVRF